MSEPARGACPSFLRGYPGAVLHLSANGVILDSNGRLEQELGHEVIGRSFATLLDRDSSGQKWERLLAADSRDTGEAWELILAVGGNPVAPRPFSLIPEQETDSIWLMEHPRDPRLDRLGLQVTEVNSELSRAQRELSKERARLARALEELHRRSEELERSNRELDQFAYIVSHDLKAPLRSISSFARYIEEDSAGTLTAESLQHLETLQKRVRHMEALIQGMLEFSRAGRQPPRTEVVDTHRLVAEIVEMLGPPPELEITVEAGLPTLEADRMQLEQVLQNLIGNAIKYCRVPSPRIRIGARRCGDFFEFEVQDNGPGIATRLHDRVWGIFFTGRASHEVDSTGVGLAVVKKLVEGQGGRVGLRSEPGQGSTFCFSWPISPGAGAREDIQDTRNIETTA